MVSFGDCANKFAIDFIVGSPNILWHTGTKVSQDNKIPSVRGPLRSRLANVPECGMSGKLSQFHIVRAQSLCDNRIIT